MFGVGRVGKVGRLGGTKAIAGALPLRQVATRGRICHALVATTAQAMSRNFHVARTAITDIGIRVPNWYVVQSALGQETGTGADITVKASIEYPIGGTRYPLTWGGASTRVIADGQDADSDLLALAIPAGASFYVHIYRTGMASMPYFSPGYSSGGDSMEYGATVTDRTASGSPANTGSPKFSPSAIFGHSNTKAAFLFGDSRVMGTGDVADSSGDIGELARTLGQAYPYINGAIGSTRVQGFAAGGNARRLALATDFCTHVYCNYGINDIGASRSAAQIKADYETALALFGGKPVSLSTISPSSTGAWTLADGSDQTTIAANGVRVTVNGYIRGLSIAGQTVFAESANVVELVVDGGKWKAPGYTTDGLHPSQLANIAIRDAAVVALPVSF